MKVAIMQPYFLPYIGYFQLIGAVDLFVIYDNIKYTKKGWINRNRMLCNGKDALFSLPLMHGEDSCDIRDRRLAAEFDRSKLLNRVRELYRRAPHVEPASACMAQILRCDDGNLFGFVYHSIVCVCDYLRLHPKFIVSSEVPIDHRLKGEEKVLAICRELGAETYVNPIGGTGLYSKEAFADHGLELIFLRPKPFVYPQFEQPFVPWLSILDIMMFNPASAIEQCVRNNFDLI